MGACRWPRWFANFCHRKLAGSKKSRKFSDANIWRFAVGGRGGGGGHITLRAVSSDCLPHLPATGSLVWLLLLPISVPNHGRPCRPEIACSTGHGTHIQIALYPALRLESRSETSHRGPMLLDPTPVSMWRADSCKTSVLYLRSGSSGSSYTVVCTL